MGRTEKQVGGHVRCVVLTTSTNCGFQPWRGLQRKSPRNDHSSGGSTDAASGQRQPCFSSPAGRQMITNQDGMAQGDVPQTQSVVRAHQAARLKVRLLQRLWRRCGRQAAA